MITRAHYLFIFK